MPYKLMIQSQNIEIEKRRLIRKIPKYIHQIQKMHILQYYIAQKNNQKARIRIIDGHKYIQTIKTKNRGQIGKIEKEIDISQAHFADIHHIFELYKLRPIIKTRTIINLGKKYNNLKGEIDAFLGKLNKIIYIEIEFSSAEEMEKFQPPKRFGKEVTDDISSYKLFKKLNNI